MFGPRGFLVFSENCLRFVDQFRLAPLGSCPLVPHHLSLPPRPGDTMENRGVLWTIGGSHGQTRNRRKIRPNNRKAYIINYVCNTKSRRKSWRWLFYSKCARVHSSKRVINHGTPHVSWMPDSHELPTPPSNCSNYLSIGSAVFNNVSNQCLLSRISETGANFNENPIPETNRRETVGKPSNDNIKQQQKCATEKTIRKQQGNQD